MITPPILATYPYPASSEGAGIALTLVILLIIIASPIMASLEERRERTRNDEDSPINRDLERRAKRAVRLAREARENREARRRAREEWVKVHGDVAPPGTD